MSTFQAESTFQVKGSSIASKLAYLSENGGEAAEGEARLFLKENGITTVLEATWYPYEIYDSFLAWIAQRHFGGDLSRLENVGRFSAQKALTTTYAAFARVGDFARFLEKMPVLHKRYYSHGKLIPSLLLPGATHCEILLEGAPVYGEPDLYIAAGFYRRAAEMMGFSNVRCTFKKDARRVRFKLDWQA